MSDESWPGTPPPPPPSAAPPPPPRPGPGFPQPGPWTPGAPSSFPEAAPGYVPAQPPRPSTPVGGLLLLGGALLVGVGSFLVWFTFLGQDVTGFTRQGFGDDETGDGVVFVFFAIVLGAFGVTVLAAGRVLAVAIIAVVVAAFTALAALGKFADVQDLKDITETFGGDEVTIGPGLPVILVGSLLALAGSIVVLSKRRRWR